MTDPRARSSELRVEIPTLEPDDAFIAQLAALAAQAARPATHPVARGGWRIAVAAASVAGVVGGGAWLAAAVTGTESPTPPTPPATHPQPDHKVATPTLPGGGASPSTGRSTDPDASRSLATGTDDGTAPAAQPTSEGAARDPGADHGPDDEHGMPQGHPSGGQGTPGPTGSPGADGQDATDGQDGTDDQNGADDQDGTTGDHPGSTDLDTSADVGDSSDLPDAAEGASGSHDQSAGG